MHRRRATDSRPRYGAVGSLVGSTIVGTMTDSPVRTTMTAAVLHQVGGRLSIEPVPIPQPGHGQILIKVIACGVCHSDLHAVDGDWNPGPTIPSSLGMKWSAGWCPSGQASIA